MRIICLYSPVFYVLNYILGEGGGGGGGVSFNGPWGGGGGGGGGGGASSNGLYGETPPEMGYFSGFRYMTG